jgi:uncharacterized membrane protein YsdA (DUF1294 family)
VLVVLLIGPAWAIYRLSAWLDWRVLAGTSAALSLVTALAYRSDKRRAETGAWRIPELTLHLCELLGGWPGAFLAQRFLRHKNAKISYQIFFWLIVAFHQLVALDFLFDGKISRYLLKT